MAKNQNEYPVPSNGKRSSIRNASLLPRFYRTDSNKKFISSTIDQLVQPGKVKKVNGYIGRQNAKSSTGSNIFVKAVDDARQNYQLEPSLVVKDNLGNVEYFKDYIDYINQLSVFGANTSNHERLNKQEFYSWNPHIDWDKFVNFQQYYWLPYGPDVIDVYGQQKTIVSTYTVEVESEGNSKEYLFTPNGLTRNPILKLYRGQTYHFEVNSPGEPFSIKTTKTSGTLDRYTWGVDTTAAVEKGTIVFKVPDNAPNVLFYVSENDANLGGIFTIYDIKDNTEIDVENEILGKKSYKLPNGTPLSNGMKLKFRGAVLPEKYANDLFYVEGVGSKITLVAERDLAVISSYSDVITVPFDDTTFDYYPFDIASSYSNKKDYIVINRASKDRNAWARYNRWFHKDVIEASSAYNGQIASLDQTSRAKRPIIEFEAGLKLYNFGLESILDVDLIDTFTTDAFSTIEGQTGYSIDGIQLVNGHRIIFAAETDILVKNKIYRVEFIEVTPPGKSRSRQIRLVEESNPIVYQTALIKYGNKNQGLMYWFNGSNWIVGQQKTSVNQPPFFDVVDENRISYSDKSVYDGSTFVGTKIFSYAVGNGTADSELGFALKYKNISNVGDIVFDFNLLTDTFIYKTLVTVNTVKLNVGSLIKATNLTTYSYVNGWETSQVERYQPIVRVYRNSGKVNDFNIDVFDDLNNLDDLEVRIYVNGKRLDKSMWQVVDGPAYKKVVLVNDIGTDDVLTIRAFSQQKKNATGYYEIPVNLQNNPLNEDISQFTLGEVIDHVDSIIDNLTTFSGTYPGPTNLRDLGNISPFGTKFIQHSGALPLALYHTTSKNSNVIKALERSRDDYGKFKREFILAAENLGIDTDTPKFVDLILEEINKNKPKTAPYYFSDMVAYGASVVTEITVVDYRTKTYPLANNFTLAELTPRSVLVYVNGVQILHGKDYTFDGTGFVVVTYSELANDDVIKIVEYENTDGSFIPSTPTKLGIWPKFEPKKYLDTTLVTPREVIQGHDGSIIMAYGDYRDDLLLELEKRIFNNIKVEYNVDLFDINDYIPRYNSNNDYSLDEFNKVLAPAFFQWSTLVNRDFSKQIGFDKENPFTYNYIGQAAPDGREVPGYWKGIYRWMFDTDRPHLTPWEMLGFSIEPSWWQEVYGPAPYTYDNIVMWQDLSEGVIRDPNAPIVRNPKYVRPYLLDCIPASEDGNIRHPIDTNTALGLITSTIASDFIFGDVGPVESAWRRSSYYCFDVVSAIILNHPAEVIGRLFDRSRIYRDLSGQIVYKDTGVRLKLKDIVLPNIYGDSARVQTAGLVNFLIDYIQSDNLKSLSQYKYDLANLTAQLSYRIAGFTEKEKFNLLLDSKNPTAVGGVFVPQENYSIELNTGSPVKKITYSGVIITKLTTNSGVGYEVKGYSKTSPYFYYYPWVQLGYPINVGGISESFSEWAAEKQYLAGKIVRNGNGFYRVTVTHKSGTEFEAKYFQTLPSLPIVGGQDAYIRTGWDKDEVITVPYGTIFRTIQEVVDFLLGHGEYLTDQGFVFDDFNNNLGTITNWVTASKEFLFWTTQNWSTGQYSWTDWEENTNYKIGSFIRYEGDIYKVIKNINSGLTFNPASYAKVEELSTVGASVIALSPAANSLIMNLSYAVIEDIRDQFNGYEFFRPDGQKLEPEFLNSYRDGNTVQYTPSTEYGIYGATFYLIQKEHVLLMDNTTLFNDTIYEPTTGYRQEKIKISSYVSTDWYGGFDIPGFIYDQAKISNWEPWQDYNLGDVVKYKEFYYTANSFLPGVEEFNANNWIKLRDKPKSQMLPNWTYKAEQFTDFYSLDSDNFDVGQQKMAQHLIGYQKRQYLENIIKDDISEYKFYQGMIIEKGTQNVLNKLFDVLSADNMESLKFFEEWAIRVGNYGSSDAFEEIEFVLDESLFKLNPQPIELVNQKNIETFDFVIRQTPTEVYLKPLGYNSNPWPVNTNYYPYLRTPGFVRSEDVALSLNILDDLVALDSNGIPLYTTTDYQEGNYFWCAFEGASWNVYRLTKALWVINAISYASNSKTLSITTDINHNLSAGDIIALKGAVGANYFFKVETASTNEITIIQQLDEYPNPDTNVPGAIQTYIFTSQRVDNVNNLNNYIPSRLLPNELIWVDNDSTGSWAVYKHNNVFASSTFNISTPEDNLAFGKAVAVDKLATVSAISNAKNELLVYNKAGIVTPWVQGQTITLSGSEGNITSFADVIEFSLDKQWLIVGTPDASNLITQYKGVYNALTTYVAGDIVKVGTVIYKAVSTTTGNSPTAGTQYWKQAASVDTSRTGTSSGLASQGMVSIYQRDANGEYVLVKHMTSPSPTASKYFGSAIKFAGDNTLLINSLNSDNSGSVYRFDYKTFNGSAQWVLSNTVFPLGTESTTITSNDFYGLGISSSLDGTTVAISAQGTNSNTGTVFVYNLDTNNNYVFDHKVVGAQTGQRYGSAISVSNYADYLAVGSNYFDINGLPSSNEGKVEVYNLNTNQLVQTIYSRLPEDQQLFGAKIAFMNDYDSLVIYSKNGDAFDPNTLASTIDTGRIDVYDLYSTTWIYAESLTIPDIVAADGFGFAFAVADDHILVSAPFEYASTFEAGAVFDFQRYLGNRSWSVYRNELPKVDLAKIKKVFLYNKKSNELVKYLDIVDPIQGNIIGIAEQEIKFKTYYDPATYSYQDSTNTTNVNVDDGMAWTDKNVGMLWWNLSTAKFIDPYNGDVVYRNTNWNTLYDTASIDIYEWVETTLKPSAWDKQADTTAGLTNGISGTSLYGDAIYSIKQRYDNVAKTFKPIYYFWVKNKTTVPNVVTRNMSANDVAKAITDPKGQGYQYIAFTGQNSFSLVNVAPLLNHTDIHLGIEVWTIDQYDINDHSEWRLISNDPNSSLPSRIESKLIDSLCGKDQAGRVVPDYDLPAKLRYGVEERPRQSMFINRHEALKEYIERVNSILLNYTVVEDRDISDLNKVDTYPSVIEGLYDTAIDTDAELRFIGTSVFKIASLTPVIVDGHITNIKIIDAGLGYVNAPYLDIRSSSGINAKLKTVLNARGQVSGVIVENSGEGYGDDTTISIRSLSTLVKADSNANGNWSIYSYNPATLVWSRVRSQAYDVTKYWKYVDWYASGYTSFDLVDHIVDAVYLLPTIEVLVGQLVKVKNLGVGGWVILEKYSNSTSIDYTQSYKIVARQNGTIQFLDTLYTFANTKLGYDGPLYDGDNFDNTAVTELRIVLTAIKDKLLIDDLKSSYLDAFFAVIRYAFSEQTFVDWAFKTSFVRAQHNVGPLLEKVTYNNDNLADFEKYINEVKPYRTKVREFVSSYTSLDNTRSVVTDFDLQSTYVDGVLDIIDTRVRDGEIIGSVPQILEYPWRHWYDNVGFEVTSIELLDGGSNYLSAPTVKIENDSGSGAIAKAYLNNGKVNRIELLKPGSGYLKAPTITFEGGLNVNGVHAKAAAIIGNSVVRSSLVKIKFDRVSGQYFITNLQETETFTATGSQLTFNLKWSPTLNRNDSSVTVNGIDALDGTFKLSSKKSVTRGYTSYYGQLTFTTPPPAGATVQISYIKDFNYLSAADRINFYYDPATKELGKYTSQLMNGVDYGGVQIIGLGFSVPQGWGSLPWFTDGWDSLDPSYDDYLVLMSLNNLTHNFELPYTPEAGEQINIYHKASTAADFVRLDDLNYAGNYLPEKPEVIMQTFVGNGVNKVINIPVSFTIAAGDKFIFRKSTSDGSVKLNENDYDTALSGGNLAYSTATGLAAEDILVDGDGFVTPTSSHGPEEVVPGQVVDTLALKVTTRPNDGSAHITYNNYVYDGSTLTFPLGNALNSPQAVAVLFSTLKRPLVIDTDFTVDYLNKEVTLISVPGMKSVVSIISFGYAGAGLVEIDYFVADGTTNEFITGATWTDAGANGIVYVNGQSVPYVLFKTDATYDVSNVVGIRFTEVLSKNSIIHYAIVNSIEETFSVMKTETFVTDGIKKKYTLKNKIGTSMPLEANMLVYSTQNNSVYDGPSGTYYVIDNNQLTYSVPPTRFLPYSIDASTISVLINGTKLKSGIDYTLDLSGIEIKLKQRVYDDNVGAELVISVDSTNSYTCDGTSITFTEKPDAGLTIVVTSFYKHNYLEIQRTNLNVTADVSIEADTVEYYDYIGIFGKHIRLDRPVLDDSRVWLVRNGHLLQHSIDYKLNSDLHSVQLADEPAVGDKFTVMTFSNNVVRNAFRFMQFKDMLNRTHYKRLSSQRQTVLARDLHYNDTEIVIADERVLNNPYKPAAGDRQNAIPGIIEIFGERIEYFVKTGNVLTQLRRGTLGTGVRPVYPAGTKVQDIGASETIPYKDETQIEEIIHNGVDSVYTMKEILPMKDVIDAGHSYTTSTNWESTYDSSFVSTIPTNYIQGDDIEVFAGGYEILGDWSSNVSYSVNDIVMVGSYLFRCKVAHTSSTIFDETNWNFFVGNIRLKKHPYKVHNVNKHYESTEGDIQLEPDFAVDGTTKTVRLTNMLTSGTKFTVVKKTGKVWENQNSSLASSDNPVAKFILAELDLVNVVTDSNGQTLTDNDGNILEL